MKWFEEAQYQSDKGGADLAESGQGILSLTRLRGMRDPTPGQRYQSVDRGLGRVRAELP